MNIRESQENQQLISIAETILEDREKRRAEELEKLKNIPLPSMIEFERGDQNPDRAILLGRLQVTHESLRKIQLTLELVRRARRNGSNFNVCRFCGSIFSWPEIIEAQKTRNLPLEDLPCTQCEKVVKEWGDFAPT